MTIIFKNINNIKNIPGQYSGGILVICILFANLHKKGLTSVEGPADQVESLAQT